ncbi:uncharacterized protein LOC107857260 [Capsicum annuum]|uniref:uncharacterized protein LOC107857260 n=1 Tax=Capsicum annuum TaxID=4072 RepID=UPI001FB078B7|nr:uncharacterized protein LOC107857260 [Capsicum annuum]
MEGTDKIIHEIKGDFSQLSKTIVSHSTSIKQLETQIGKISTQINARPSCGLPSDTIVNPKNNAQVLAIVIRSGRTLGDLLIEDLGEKVPKVKPKDVPPQSHEQENNKKELVKVDDEVVENEKRQNNARPTIQVPTPFPQRLHRKEEGEKLKKFMTKLSNLSINIPLLEAIQEILRYAKLMKKLMSKKKLIKGDKIEVSHGCSVIVSSKVAEKKEVPGEFIIPCTIETHMFAKALCDLGASMNLMPFSIYKNLGLDAPIPIFMRLLIVDKSIKRPIRILFDVLVKLRKFILSVNFVVLDCKMDQEVKRVMKKYIFGSSDTFNYDYGEEVMDIMKIDIMEAMDITMTKIYVRKKATTLDENMRRMVALSLIEKMERMKSLVMVLIRKKGHVKTITLPTLSMKVM